MLLHVIPIFNNKFFLGRMKKIAPLFRCVLLLTMSGYDPTVYVRATRNQQTPKYDREELAIIKQYKERYMNATTPAERRHVVVGDLCLELFNFWVLSRHVCFTELEKERRVDVCPFVYIFDIPDAFLLGSPCICTK